MLAPVLRLLSSLLLAGLLVSSVFVSSAFAQSRPKIERAELGFNGRYKVGCWTPLRLELKGGAKPLTVVAEVSLPDSDGLLAVVTSPPLRLSAGERTVTPMLVRIGQLDSPVKIRLLHVPSGKVVAKKVFKTVYDIDEGGVMSGEPATVRMIVEVGPSHLGAASMEAEKESQQWYSQNIVSRVPSPLQLPSHWLAYEAVDTLLLSASDRDAWAGLRPDDPRIGALCEWVEMGGRVVLFCGRNSDQVLGPGGPLARLAPGEFRQMETIDDFRKLEAYVGAGVPIPRRSQLRLAVPRLAHVRGDVELELGSGETGLPLIVRARQGLGQVVFVAMDADQAPLRHWKSRGKLVDKLLAFGNDDLPKDTETNYYYGATNDLSAAVSQRLDQELESSGIKTPPFLAIAGLVVLYILLIGPGDYFFVKHVLKRMEATWVTFPLIVLTTCLAAYGYADYLKGNDLRINQVELLDIDCTTGLARGTMWTHLFSPSPERYSLTLDARTPSGDLTKPKEATVAWLGRPGEGLGGMNADAGTSFGRAAYAWSTDRSVIRGMPIEVWSTKTFATRWQGQTTDTIDATLAPNGTGGVVGDLVNQSGVDLIGCKLVYGRWAWRIGDLAAGATATIKPPGAASSSEGPRNLRAAFEQDHHFQIGKGDYYEQQTLFQKVDLAGLTEMMMFHDALGGYRRTYQRNRYQHFVDLSRALDGDTAMLLGRVAAPRSELARLDSQGKSESMRGDKDLYVTLYRFLLPVTKGRSDQ